MPDFYTIYRNVIPQPAIDSALRLIWLDIFEHGLSIDDAKHYHEIKCWLPHLRYSPDILNLITPVTYPAPPLNHRLCEPQIILHFPDRNPHITWGPHQDEPPPWANGRKYSHIIGVALTHSNSSNGGLMIWPNWPNEGSNSADTYTPSLSAGDIISINPDTGHSGGANTSGEVRVMVYFRYLEPVR